MTKRYQKNLTNYIIIPSAVALSGEVGVLLARRAAFPFWRRTASLTQVLLAVSPSSSPVCLACAAVSFFTWIMASLCQPPSVSTTINRKVLPSLLQSFEDSVIFVPYRWARAAPWPLITSHQVGQGLQGRQ